MLPKEPAALAAAKVLLSVFFANLGFGPFFLHAQARDSLSWGLTHCERSSWAEDDPNCAGSKNCTSVVLVYCQVQALKSSKPDP